MLDLRLVKFCKLFIELRHCFGPLSDQVAVQGPLPQGFDGLCDDLNVGHFWGLSFEL
jgi:hypothetical protein